MGKSWWWILRASTASLMLSPNQRLRRDAQATPEEILVPPAAPMIRRTSPFESTNTAGHMDDNGRLPVWKEELSGYTIDTIKLKIIDVLYPEASPCKCLENF